MRLRRAAFAAVAEAARVPYFSYLSVRLARAGRDGEALCEAVQRQGMRAVAVLAAVLQHTYLKE